MMSAPHPTPTPEGEPASASSSIDLDQEPAEVWAALVDGDALSAWLGAGSEIEAVPGGRLSTPDVVTGEPKEGVVSEVEPEHRLSFCWWPVEPSRDVVPAAGTTATVVTIELAPLGPGTRVTVTETHPHRLASSAIAGPGTLRGARRGSAVDAQATLALPWRLAMLAVAVMLVATAGAAPSWP